jgi:hypothetical protein
MPTGSRLANIAAQLRQQGAQTGQPFFRGIEHPHQIAVDAGGDTAVTLRLNTTPSSAAVA